MMADIAILPTSNNQGIQFEQSHVQSVYNEIASRVNDIQHKAWPNVKRFIKKFEPGALIADIGCGNGRYLGINKKVYKIGIDVCKAMVDNSRQKGYEVAYADNLNIPFRDAMFDGVISIGVVHHFCSVERRIQALHELARVLQPGGRLMLYVWAYEQKHRKFDSQDVLVPWHEHRKHRFRAGSSSSRHSSQGGLSSASSLSEDDSVDQGYQPIENGSQTASPQTSRRRSSASLDDLTSVLERSSFKPSYYSLDFTVSPGLKKSGTDYAELSRKTAKQNVVSECRKLEASLRAMSLDSFEEIKQLVDKAEYEEKDSLNDVFIEHTSAKTKHMTDGYLTAKNGPERYILAPSENENQSRDETDCKFYIGSQNEGKENREEDSVPAHSSKINPFLKQNSMDSYTFNNILKEVNTEQVLDAFIEENEVQADLGSTEEVFVNFKPMKVPSKSQSESFISSIKSKFFKIFSDESIQAAAYNEETKCAKRPSDSSVECNKVLSAYENHRHLELYCTQPSSSLCNSPNSSGKSELTEEQQEMAKKLDFKVREFPQSSQPKLKEEFKPSEAFTDQSQNDNSGINTSQNLNHIYESQRNFLQTGSKPLKDFKTSYTETCKQSCTCKRQASNENEMISHIYDGYIKIDLDISKDRHLNEMGALQTDLNAKMNGAINNNIKDCDNGFTHFTFSDQPLCNDFDADLKQNGSYNKQCNIYNETSQTNQGQVKTVFDNYCGPILAANDTSHQQCNSNSLPNDGFTQDDEVTTETDSNFSSKLCRYYHVFREGEIEALIGTHVKELQVLQCYYDHANWCVVAEKI